MASAGESGANVRRLYHSGREVFANTADYSVVESDFDKVLTTRGAASEVVFTLPAAADSRVGAMVWFFNVADQNMKVSGVDGELVVKNDLTANDVSFETSSEKIGGGFLAVCDGTSWIVVPLAEETQTMTVVT